MIHFIKKLIHLINNYIISRALKRPSTAQFWYLKEPSNLTAIDKLIEYKAARHAPFYFIDYREKLNYTLENPNGIIVLPYQNPIGNQINPEAAFQYTLGLYDKYLQTGENSCLQKFLNYANYFRNVQTESGLWEYNFNWYEIKKPWYSALAQSRGASVMLRAWQLSKNDAYLSAAKQALSKFNLSTAKNGFLHTFSKCDCQYFEEYPHNPSGVINGFMASLMSIWEMNYWLKESWLQELWEQGIRSLEIMLPYYTNGWWSLYDLDERSPIVNVNSPRYHLLEINYLQILSLLSSSLIVKREYECRVKQYKNPILHLRALTLKTIRKLLYR